MTSRPTWWGAILLAGSLLMPSPVRLQADSLELAALCQAFDGAVQTNRPEETVDAARAILAAAPLKGEEFLSQRIPDLQTELKERLAGVLGRQGTQVETYLALVREAAGAEEDRTGEWLAQAAHALAIRHRAAPEWTSTLPDQLFLLEMEPQLLALRQVGRAGGPLGAATLEYALAIKRRGNALAALLEALPGGTVTTPRLLDRISQVAVAPEGVLAARSAAITFLGRTGRPALPHLVTVLEGLIHATIDPAGPTLKRTVHWHLVNITGEELGPQPGPWRALLKADAPPRSGERPGGSATTARPPPSGGGGAKPSPTPSEPTPTAPPAAEVLPAAGPVASKKRGASPSLVAAVAALIMSLVGLGAYWHWRRPALVLISIPVVGGLAAAGIFLSDSGGQAISPVLSDGRPARGTMITLRTSLQRHVVPAPAKEGVGVPDPPPIHEGASPALKSGEAFDPFRTAPDDVTALDLFDVQPHGAILYLLLTNERALKGRLTYQIEQGQLLLTDLDFEGASAMSPEKWEQLGPGVEALPPGQIRGEGGPSRLLRITLCLLALLPLGGALFLVARNTAPREGEPDVTLLRRLASWEEAHIRSKLARAVEQRKRAAAAARAAAAVPPPPPLAMEIGQPGHSTPSVRSGFMAELPESTIPAMAPPRMQLVGTDGPPLAVTDFASRKPTRSRPPDAVEETHQRLLVQALWTCLERAGQGDPETATLVARCFETAAPQHPGLYRFALGWYLCAAGAGAEEAVEQAEQMMPHVPPGEGCHPVLAFYRSASAGSREAAFALAEAFHRGEGVGQDARQAAIYYKQAAQKGHPEAEFHMGRCFEFGEGVPESPKDALKWYTRSAQQGLARAQYQLGRIYAKSSQQFADYKKLALKWYLRAAQQDHPLAIQALERMAGSEAGSEGVMKEVLGHFVRIRKRGPEAMVAVGRRLQTDEEVVDPRGAAAWFRKAADTGDPRGQVALGECYETGSGVEQDPKQALKWFMLAGDQGYPPARYHLGQWYQAASTQNPALMQTAVEHYLSAADAAETQAIRALEALGEVEMDPAVKEVVMYYLQATCEQVPDALLHMGNCYRNGLGVTQDLSCAIRWFERAARRGMEQAFHVLEELGVAFVDGEEPRTPDEEQSLIEDRPPAEIEPAAGEAPGLDPVAAAASGKLGTRALWRAAHRGDAQAQLSLGIKFETGSGVEQDTGEALKWFMLAAEQGYAPARYRLGRFYQVAGGRKPGLMKQAVQHYLAAAEAGIPDAVEALESLGDVEIDPVLKRVVLYYLQGTLEQVPKALYHLGVCYQTGVGVDRDLEEATRWYRRAGEEGFEQAQKALEELTASRSRETAQSASEGESVLPPSDAASSTGKPM